MYYKIDENGKVLGASSIKQEDAGITTFIKEERPSDNHDWVDGVWVLDTVKEEADKDAKVRQTLQIEADPLFFKWQRDEATEQEWLDKVAEVKARFE